MSRGALSCGAGQLRTLTFFYTVDTTYPQIAASANQVALFFFTIQNFSPPHTPAHSTMFRKFTPGENVSGAQQLKSSVQRGIRAKIAEQFPQLEDEGVLDELMPKKCTMVRGALGPSHPPSLSLPPAVASGSG